MRAIIFQPFLILGTFLWMVFPADLWATSSQADLEWWRLSADIEASRYVDDDLNMFDGAEGQTQSMYVSKGRGLSWMGFGLNLQNLENDYLDSLSMPSSWNHRAVRAMFVAKPTFKSFQGHVAGFYSKGRAQWGGQGVQIGAKRWFPHSKIMRSLDLRIGWTHHSIDRSTSSGSDSYDVQKTTQQTLSTWVILPTQAFLTEVAFLGSRRASLSRGAVLLRLRAKSDAELKWNLDLLHGSQETWYDADKLVLHDGSRPMEGLASFGMTQPLRGDFSLHGSIGIEIDRGHQSHWFHLGLAFGRQRWIMN